MMNEFLWLSESFKVIIARIIFDLTIKIAGRPLPNPSNYNGTFLLSSQQQCSLGNYQLFVA